MHVLKRGGSVNESARRYVCIEERRLHERIRAVMKWLLHGNEIRLILTQTLRNCTQNAPSLPRSQLAMGHTNRGKLDEQGLHRHSHALRARSHFALLHHTDSIRIYSLPLRLVLAPSAPRVDSIALQDAQSVEAAPIVRFFC